MFNFFSSDREAGFYIIKNGDFNHIKNVLRMKEGDSILISQNAQSHLCKISRFEEDCLLAEIIEENYKSTELPIKITLFQGLPKSDKMEQIIQKCTELGVSEFVPVEMKRCVVRLEEKKKEAKRERWQSISEAAAKQSKRNIVPEVLAPVSFKDALKLVLKNDITLVPYENKDGMSATLSALKKIKVGTSVGIMIGPEGGFEESEINELEKMGAHCISLGSRILRTETAAAAASAMCMLYAEINLNGENK